MKSRVADPALRREVEAAVRRRVRGEDADDVVQATLADVLEAPRVPEEPEEFRRFVFGIARNKVFDHYRRQKRHPAAEAENELAAPEPPLSARDMLRWAEGELPDPEARSTLEWMLREGDGEKLETIARDAQLPAPRVRKRVSRLRKFLRERWAAELGLIGLLLVCGALGALYWYGRGKSRSDVVEREPPVVPTPAPSAVPSSRPAGNLAPEPSPLPPAKKQRTPTPSNVTSVPRPSVEPAKPKPAKALPKKAESTKAGPTKTEPASPLLDDGELSAPSKLNGASGKRQAPRKPSFESDSK